MAKKKSKGSKKAANHGKNLAGAMKSVSTSKTPISTLYPKKVTVGDSRTSPKFMQRGTKSPSKSAMPLKMLLQVSNPGPRPNAPTAVPRPGESPSQPRKGFKTGVPTDNWLGGMRKLMGADAMENAYNAETGRFGKNESGEQLSSLFDQAMRTYDTSTRNYNTYLSNLNTYNRVT